MVKLISLCMLILVVSVWISCSPTSTQTTDNEELTSLTDESIDDFSTDIRDEMDAFNRPDENIPNDGIPFRRYTHKGPRTVTVEVHEIDITHDYRWALVTKTVPYDGSIKVWPNDSVMWEKTFTDVAVRSAYFEKRNSSSAHRGWELRKITPVRFYSSGATQLIDSIHVISSGGYEHWFRGPDELISVDSLPTFDRGDNLTVTTYAEGGSICVLHVKKPHRLDMVEGTFGVYESGFEAQDDSGKRHIAVDWVSHATIYDSLAAYQSEAWGFLYKKLR